MIKRKKICFCRDTDTQVDILNAKQVWVPTKYSYDKYAKQMLPIKMKMIGYAERSLLHEINPKIAKSHKEIDKGDSIVVIDDVQIAPVDKELDTIQEFFVAKEQLLEAINKNRVMKPDTKK